VIDWAKVAKEYRLTPEQFRKEVYTVAAVCAAMELDQDAENTAMRFICSDQKSQLQLEVKRC
jgi:hypothetical protein